MVGLVGVSLRAPLENVGPSNHHGAPYYRHANEYLRLSALCKQTTVHAFSQIAEMSSSPGTTNAGIVTDENSGQRHIPESMRPDGSTRKAIKIRPGYKPPEDVEVYKNRTAQNFRSLGKGGVPGAVGLKDDTSTPASAANNKNAKRREARKKAKAAEGAKPEGGAVESEQPEDAPLEAKPAAVDAEVELEKKAGR